MTIQPLVSWLDVYQKLVALEAQLQDLSQLVLTLKPEELTIECHHPVRLEGIWAGAEITEDDVAAARQSMFPYEREAFEV